MWLNVWYIQVESKYKEMRHATLETGAENRRKKRGGGGWASWTAQALFAWTRTHDEPGKSGTCGYIAAGLLRADVSFGHRAPARFWTVGAKASHGKGRLLDACFRVFARCAKKKLFNSFTSFSRWKWFKLWPVIFGKYQALSWAVIVNSNRSAGRTWVKANALQSPVIILILLQVTQPYVQLLFFGLSLGDTTWCSRLRLCSWPCLQLKYWQSHIAIELVDQACLFACFPPSFRFMVVDTECLTSQHWWLFLNGTLPHLLPESIQLQSSATPICWTRRLHRSRWLCHHRTRWICPVAVTCSCGMHYDENTFATMFSFLS